LCNINGDSGQPRKQEFDRILALHHVNLPPVPSRGRRRGGRERWHQSSFYTDAKVRKGRGNGDNDDDGRSTLVTLMTTLMTMMTTTQRMTMMMRNAVVEPGDVWQEAE
jgi:hypothetical protein